MSQPRKIAIDPSKIPAFDRAMRAIVNVPKSEVDAARRKELKRKPSTRKRKGK
jgi:hypothetical protein